MSKIGNFHLNLKISIKFTNLDFQNNKRTLVVKPKKKSHDGTSTTGVKQQKKAV